MIKKIEKLIRDFVAFVKLYFYTPVPHSKTLLVEFKNPQLYHRFFYLMLKFYKISGYNIYFPMSFSMFRNLRNKDLYLSLLVKERNFLSIRKKNLPKNRILIDDQMFSPDYFHSYFEEQNQEQNCFHIPMSFHPYMYHYNIWNHQVSFTKARKNAIFCYGNFDKKAYLEIKKTTFKVTSRTEILSFFEKKENFILLENKEKTLQSLTSNEFDKKYVFATRENYSLAMEDVREVLSHFNFYLCCPGVVMPLCHNVIEAMSVGTIPIIEREYAEVMYPNLQHKIHAIIFEDLQHLDQILQTEIFTFSEQEISKMRNHILEYYNEYLTPTALIKHLNKSIQDKKLIYLQAEHRSVKIGI